MRLLSFGEAEATVADRVMLGARGEGPCPSLEDLQCFRSLWIAYAIHGGGDEGVFSELEVDRRGCEGFLRHRPGWSPNEHRDLLSRRLETREKIALVALGSLLTLIGALLLAWAKSLLSIT
jgi:hypothetical protein